MLESLPARNIQQTVVRFQRRYLDDLFLRDQEMDPAQTTEMKEFLELRGMSDSIEDLVDGPFKPKPRLWKTGFPGSRYSDGSFPVGYFSLEADTAMAEVQYWFSATFAGKPSGPRTGWYSRFSCDFRGEVKDLRPMAAVWSDLTHDSDYAFCNQLGDEAVSTGLHALLAPSARRSGGTNVPVFARPALSNPREHSLVPVTYVPPSGKTGL